MGVMDPKVKSMESTSQATPLANDVLGMLRNQIQSGAMGSGTSDLQRNAGTAIQQFVNSGGFNSEAMRGSLLEQHNTRVNEGASAIRQSFGNIGGRFGSGVAKAEGGFRANAEADFGAKLGELDLRGMDQFLNAIMGMQNMGVQNSQPFFALASQGINPQDRVVGDSTMTQISGFLASLGQLASAFKGMP